jgi:hypothetical protein
VLRGAGISDTQIDLFTRAEQKQLATARHIPSRYQNEFIYAIYRDDIRREARACLERLLEALRPRRERRG